MANPKFAKIAGYQAAMRAMLKLIEDDDYRKRGTEDFVTLAIEEADEYLNQFPEFEKLDDIMEKFADGVYVAKSHVENFIRRSMDRGKMD